MAVNGNPATLLELLACPSCGNELAPEFAGLRCTRCDRAFPLDGRVPILLDNGHSHAGPSTLARLQYAILSNPRLYDFHQAHGGGRPIAAQVRKELDDLGRRTLLDIGAGTGMVASLIRADTRYVWLDNDALKLRGFLSKAIDCYAVLGDAARLPFRDRSVDWTVMVEVSHHLPDSALHACLDEAARVTRERFVFVDWVRGPRLRSKLLGQLDLGRFPRTEGELLLALEMSFEIEKVERFRINHDHLLCVCVPRRTAV
jgi:SAM-dependent methyltransferase